MSANTDPTPIVPDASGLKVTIVASSWHQQVMGGLIAGAAELLDEAGATHELVMVPGTFELPIVAAAAAPSADAIVALGVVIRGGTPHFDYVCNAATDGLTRVALDTGVPMGFGVLTCDTQEQALARAGLPDSVENKGREAALAAISTALTLKDIRARANSGGLGFAG